LDLLEADSRALSSIEEEAARIEQEVRDIECGLQRLGKALSIPL